MMKKKGFSLIELLVVISIIALLVAILMPALNKARMHGRNAQCMSNLRQWGLITRYYTDDNNDYFFIWTWGGPGPDGITNGPGTWVNYLYHYYKDGGVEMRLCPEATMTEAEGETDLAKTAWTSTLTFHNNEQEVHKNSYVINNWCYNANPENPDALWNLNSGFQARAWLKTGQSRESTIPVFSEGWRMGGAIWDRNDDIPPDENMKLGSFGRFCINRHYGGVNVCFMDGHVDRTPLKKLWSLKWNKAYHIADTTDIVKPEWPDWLDKYPE